MKWNELIEGFDFVNPMGISLWSEEGVPMRVTWVNPMGKSLWVENECPYQFDLIDLSEKVPMFSWMNVPMRMSVPINLTWLISVRKSLCSVEWMSLSKWLGTTLWESPYESREVNPMEVTGMNPMRKSLSKWSESMRNEWIEVNRVNRGEMSDLKDLTWNPFKVTWVNSVGISLWVENECPYQSDLRWVIWPNPIKMNGIDEKWMNWGE